MSAIRYMQISASLPDPFTITLPKLEYVMKGIKRVEAEKGVGIRQRLPVTPAILRKLKRVWQESGGETDTRMIWAACCLSFFAFLRIGKLTVPTESSFDPKVHLCMSDITVDDKRNPRLLRISIKQSKTDPFRKGVDLFVGRTSSDLCPVAAMLSYLERRGTGPGPLFKFSDGRFLTRAKVRSAQSRNRRL